ncbi:MAG: class B sortase [Clostridia bacterium]|nr:class B sortase [Clostridia bacterium]
MSDKEKNIPGDDETFEDIFSSLREKYNLEPFGETEDKKEENKEEEKETFYDPSADSEIDDFFKEAEEGYAALYEEVDAKIAGVDEEALRHEAEVLGVEFGIDEKPEEPVSEEKTEEPQEYEDIYSDSSDAPQEFEDVYSDSTPEEEETEENKADESTDVALIPQAEEKAEEDFEEEPKKKKGSIFPKKSDPVGEKIRKIIFLISIIALLASVAWLVNDYIIQPYLIKQQNSQVSELIDSTDEEPEKIVEKLNNLDEEEKTVTFASLKEQNKDFKAWLVVPGANISLPVVQTTNNDKYLDTGFNGKWLSGGTAFIDSNNKSVFSDMNTVIYGHNMRDGSMFGSIKNYKTLDTFKKNPLVYVYTENKNYVYKIYSVFLTSAVKSDDNGYVFAYNFINLSSSENFASFMEELKTRSYYNTGVDYQEGDKLLTLSTCDRTVMKNGRLVLVARLVRENEEETVNTAKATVNSKQKFPAGWYEKKKTTNPYENSVKWIAQ